MIFNFPAFKAVIIDGHSHQPIQDRIWPCKHMDNSKCCMLCNSVGKDVQVELITGENKNITAATAWELLNMDADEILDLPARMAKEHGLDPASVSSAITR